MTDNPAITTGISRSASTHESFYQLRTNLSLVPGPPVKTVLIASALPREGRSTVAASLALACAEGARSVLLVDADFRNPCQHANFNINNVSGLAQVLGRADMHECQVKQVHPWLDVLTSGPLPANPPDLLASPVMTGLVQFLREKYDLVIFDSPAVARVTDAVALAHAVDGVLLVIKAASTTRQQAHSAVSQLRRANPRILGAVLNAAALDADACGSAPSAGPPNAGGGSP